MPFYLSIGVSETTFWKGTPVDLAPYIEADKLRQKRTDYENWQLGIYVMGAVSTAIETALHGKKSKMKYFDEPLLQAKQKEKEAEILSEEEKKRQRDKLLMTLQIMQHNFEANHKEQGKQG